jgi:hypothetical protein
MANSLRLRALGVFRLRVYWNSITMGLGAISLRALVPPLASGMVLAAGRTWDPPGFVALQRSSLWLGSYLPHALAAGVD